MSILDKKYFYNEKQAFEYVESIIWANGKKCPHCENKEKIYKIKSKSARMGLYKCGRCKKQFTVRIGTIFEDSHIPLHKWLQAIYLISSSKKGISSHQLHRTLQITYKSAWFLSHRVREAILGKNNNCITSYEGELEHINLHGGINYFYIYPYSLPNKIKCNFPQELCDKAIDGIGRKVCIRGNAIYTQNQYFPHMMDVSEIEVYPLEKDLPDWQDLLGIAPEATGELLSEEFIRNLRDGWQ